MSLQINTRYQAFATHLVISLIILLVLLAIIFFRWFPYDLIYAGGIEGLKILIGVDMVLGPALTLIVFDRAKKSLKFDLTVIAVIQIGCLLAGLWLIYNERPIVQVLADDGIHLYTTAGFKLYEVDAVELPGKTPHKIFLNLPESKEDIVRFAITHRYTNDIPLSLRTDLFTPMQSLDKSDYQQRIAIIRELLKTEVVVAMDELPQLDCDWLPLHSIHATGYACTSYENGIIRLSERKL